LRVSLIEAPENIQSTVIGDSASWVVTQLSPRQFALKPVTCPSETNIYLLGRQTYEVRLVSSCDAAETTGVLRIGGGATSSLLATEAPPAAAPAIDGRGLSFDFNLHAQRGFPRALVPAQVFSDGSRTFVRFRPTAKAAELPVLFAVGAEGGDEPLNTTFDAASGVLIADRVLEGGALVAPNGKRLLITAGAGR
jgi:type IV secretory pathway VirB9-like protein